jgi:hypothetical protein
LHRLLEVERHVMLNLRTEDQGIAVRSTRGCRGWRQRRRGLTLVEVLVYLALTTIITVPLLVTTLASSRSSSEGLTLVRVLERNRSAFNRVTEEFRYSIAGTAVISGGGKTLQFTKQKGYDGTSPIPGSSISFEIRLDPKETLNGKDDDQDGLIDEGLLVRVDKSTGKEIVLTQTLNYAASSFAANGNRVSISLTSMGEANGKNTTGDLQLSATVTPLNSLP